MRSWRQGIRRMNEFYSFHRHLHSLKLSSRRQEALHTTLTTLTTKILRTTMIINNLWKMKGLSYLSKEFNASHLYALWKFKRTNITWIGQTPFRMTSLSSPRWKMLQGTTSWEWLRRRATQISHSNPYRTIHRFCSLRTRSASWATPKMRMLTAEIWSALDRPSPAWVFVAYQKREKLSRAAAQ